MSAADSADRKPSPMGPALRFALLFAVLGPAVGGLLAATVVTLLLTRLDGSGASAADMVDALRALLADAVVWAPQAYVTGAAPAALAGFTLGVLSASARRRVIYPAAAAVGAVAAAIPGSFAADPGQVLLLAIDGAAAALVCTAVARRFKLHR